MPKPFRFGGSLLSPSPSDPHTHILIWLADALAFVIFIFLSAHVVVFLLSASRTTVIGNLIRLRLNWNRLCSPMYKIITTTFYTLVTLQHGTMREEWRPAAPHWWYGHKWNANEQKQKKKQQNKQNHGRQRSSKQYRQGQKTGFCPKLFAKPSRVFV